MRFSFPYSISFGKGDSIGGSVSHTLSDADAERLIRSAEEGDRLRLNEDAFISDICADVYQAVHTSLQKKYLKDPEPVRDALSWKDSYDPEKPIGIEQVQEYLKGLPIAVFYPKKLQLLEAKKPAKTMTARYEIMSEAEAKEAIKKDCHENNVIILTDEGKTLYYVPQKFTGPVTVPASVRTIRSGFWEGAFNDRIKITEIIVENGITEIPERAFSNCKQVKRIILPESVKKIGTYAFTGCSSLEEIQLPEGLEEIENTAFGSCYSLKELKFPSTVKVISMHINSYNDPIGHLYFYGMETKIDGTRGGSWNGLTMHVLPGSAAEKFAMEQNIRYVNI